MAELNGPPAPVSGQQRAVGRRPENAPAGAGVTVIAETSVGENEPSILLILLSVTREAASGLKASEAEFTKFP
jgi:hypothetical protein